MPYMLLSDEELTILDGRCRPPTQLEVDKAKARLAVVVARPDLAPEVAKWLADLRREAETRGKLAFRRKLASVCPLCRPAPEYRPYTRASRYHRRGEPSEMPELMQCFELVDELISIQYRLNLGCCVTCWQRVKPEVQAILADVKAEIPEAIMDAPPRYRWYQDRRCTKCGWTGHEGQMGRRMALMGNGTYPATCPSCGAENGLFRTPVEIVDGFTLVEVNDGEVGNHKDR